MLHEVRRDGGGFDRQDGMVGFSEKNLQTCADFRDAAKAAPAPV